jgi:hypothetical protein
LEPSIIPTLVNVVKIISSADGGVGQLFFWIHFTMFRGEF